MRLTVILLTTVLMQVSASSFSQEVSLNVQRARLEKIFKAIEDQTGYVFFYNKPELAGTALVSIEVNKAPLEFLLGELLKNQPLRYAIYNKTITISRKEESKPNVAITLSPQQEPVVRGVVLIKDGGGILTGATIVNVKTKKTVLADEKGRFVIAAKPGESLLVTNVGFQPRAFIITAANHYTELAVLMDRSTSELDAVQVLAYGKTTKRFNTGNIVTVTAEEIAKNPVPNVLSVLQHKVPGMFIQQNTGLPGGSFNVEIRGRTSFGNQAPLYIVDGVAYPAGTTLPFIEPSYSTNGDSKGTRGGNALNFLDPSMIESVDVLKDADATSIYGSRGAYGVVLITTKKGKAGAPRLTASVRQSFNVRGTSPDMLNTEEFLMLRREAFANDNKTPGLNDFDLNGTWPQDRYTDWQKEITGLYAPMFDGNVSYSGGSGNLNYLVRGNFSTQKNTQKDDGAYRNIGGGFDINSTSRNRKFYFDLSGNYSSTTSDLVSWDFALGSLPLRAPNAPALFLPDGRLNWETGDNPANALNLIYKSAFNTFITNLVLEYRPINGMTIELRGGYTTIGGSELRAEPTTFFNPNQGNPSLNSNSTRLWSSKRTFTFDPNIRYTFKAGGEGRLTLNAGVTLQDVLDAENSLRGVNFISDAMLYNPAFATDAINITATYNQAPNRYLGYFGSANYNWGNKYILNAVIRYDGSTRFGQNNQFGTFGSLAGAWIVSEEPFFKPLRRTVSFMKLRGSWGTSGGDAIGNYRFLDRYVRSNYPYQGSMSLAPNQLANPHLQWEMTKKGEVGLEVGLLNDKVLLNASYYRNRTSNQIINQPLSSNTGFEAFLVNSPALIENTGFEALITSRNINKKDFRWTSTLNITIPRNKLLEYPNMEKFAINNNYVLGKSLNGIKLYPYGGVSPETGKHTFYKEGVLGEYDGFVGGLDQNVHRTEFLDLNPKYYGGITNDFTYKQFSLGFSVGITNRLGQDFIARQTFPPGLTPTFNGAAIYLNRWRQKGDITDIPKMTTDFSAYIAHNNYKLSTGAYEKATYARLNNVNIGYDLPKAVLQRAKLSNVRIMLQGQNLLTVSRYRDLDPENLGAGTAPYRTYTAGLNISL